jgi:purine-cytosine permease-like protein
MSKDRETQTQKANRKHYMILYIKIALILILENLMLWTIFNGNIGEFLFVLQYIIFGMIFIYFAGELLRHQNDHKELLSRIERWKKFGEEPNSDPEFDEFMEELLEVVDKQKK